MVLCCAIPIVGLVAVNVLNVPAGSVLYYGLFLLCPLLHLLMMRGMMGGRGHSPAEQRSVIEGEVISRQRTADEQ
jgi:hypothetical protein